MANISHQADPDVYDSFERKQRAAAETFAVAGFEPEDKVKVCEWDDGKREYVFLDEEWTIVSFTTLPVMGREVPVAKVTNDTYGFRTIEVMQLCMANPTAEFQKSREKTNI